MDTGLRMAVGRAAFGLRAARRGVIGVVSRAGKVLMIRRAPTVPKGGRWCFPGGHVEPGESLETALCREMAEELSIVVMPIIELGCILVPDTHHRLSVWSVKWLDGVLTPAPAEIDAYQWVTHAEIESTQPGLPSNRDVYEMLARRVAVCEGPAS